MTTSGSPRALESQVGGHPGVLTTEDGYLLIKPALPKEIAFYQALAADPQYSAFRGYVPEFYGTLKLEGQVENVAGELDANVIKPVEGVPEGEKDDVLMRMSSQSIVIENLSYTFLKPNILDIKLGTKLYDEDAGPEKRARMIRVAEETTSNKTGIRLTGFQVYDLAADKPVITTKAYGKSLKAADLPNGITRFFPLATPPSPVSSATVSQLATSQLHPTGLPPELLLPILSGISSHVRNIHDAMQDIELRMVGASLLVIYEADRDRALEGLRLLHEAERREEVGDDGDGEGDDSDGDGEEENDEKTLGPPFTVRVIDFAHTRLTPGQGPDQGILLGLRTVLDLLKGRIAQIEAVSLETLTAT